MLVDNTHIKSNILAWADIEMIAEMYLLSSVLYLIMTVITFTELVTISFPLFFNVTTNIIIGIGTEYSVFYQ